MRRFALVGACLPAFLALSGTSMTIAQEPQRDERAKVKQDSAKSTTRPAESERVRNDPVIRSVRRMLGRAMAFENAAQRNKKLREVSRSLAGLLQKHRADPHLTLELLTFQSWVQSELQDLAAAHDTVRRQQIVVREQLGADKYPQWLSAQLRRTGDLRLLNVARFHLEEAIANQPNQETAGILDLRIGDLLLQQGQSGAAKQHYRAAAGRRPAVWPNAMLRVVRVAVRERNVSEVESICKQIIERTPQAPEAEDARHILQGIEADRAQGKPALGGS